MYLFFPSAKRHYCYMTWAQLTLKKLYSIEDLQLWLHTSTETVNRGRAHGKKLFSGKTSVMY